MRLDQRKAEETHSSRPPPGARSSEPGARSPEPGARSPEPASSIRPDHCRGDRHLIPRPAGAAPAVTANSRPSVKTAGSCNQRRPPPLGVGDADRCWQKLVDTGNGRRVAGRQGQCQRLSQVSNGAAADTLWAPARFYVLLRADIRRPMPIHRSPVPARGLAAPPPPTSFPHSPYHSQSQP